MDRIDGSNDLVDGCVPLDSFELLLAVQKHGSERCFRCLLLVICTHPFAKEALTLHLARGEGHKRYFDCNLMHCKVLASSHQHLMAEAPCPSTRRVRPVLLALLRPGLPNLGTVVNMLGGALSHSRQLRFVR